MIDRFDFFDEDGYAKPVKVADGGWVDYDDYYAVETENANLHARIAELEAENERLKTHELLWRDTLRENTELRKANQWHPASEPHDDNRPVRCAIFRNCTWNDGFVDALGFDFNADYWRERLPMPENVK